MSDQAALVRQNTLYESDFFEWTQQQARLLRERRFDDLDLDNLIDEVESVGSSERREIRRRLQILLAHLLKWKMQPGRRGNSWSSTIHEQRSALADLVENSPSLRGYRQETVERVYRGATLAAAGETGIIISAFPRDCPFSVEQVFDHEFFPENPAEE